MDPDAKPRCDAPALPAGRRKILVIGFGNPGRRDDGLGPALAARLEELALPGVTVDSDYQLMIEHAAMVAEHDIVVFADAAADAGEEPFYFRPVDPAPGTGISSHSVSPAGVLHLAQSCFNKFPRGYLLGLRGADLSSFAEGLTPTAGASLAAALAFIRPWLQQAQAGETLRGS